MGTVSYLYIMGTIGVGKSTLVSKFKEGVEALHPADREKFENIVAFHEEVPWEILDAYIHKGVSKYLASPIEGCNIYFQNIMLGFASIGVKYIAKPGELVVIERPLHENVVFGWTLHQNGEITDSEYKSYLQLVHLFMRRIAPLPSLPSIRAICLHATQNECNKRMSDRGIKEEQDYTLDHLEVLHHGYLLFILHSQLGYSPYPFPYIEVVDWTGHGDPMSDSIRSVMNRESRSTVRIGSNPISLHESTEGVFEMTLHLDTYMKLVYAKDVRANAIRDNVLRCLSSPDQMLYIHASEETQSDLKQMFYLPTHEQREPDAQ